MDDGGNPLIGLIVFVVLLLLDAVLYGFAIAADNVSDSLVDKKAEEGNRRALWLKKVLAPPCKVYHIMQLWMTLIGVTVGIYQGRLYGRLAYEAFFSTGEREWLLPLCYAAAALIGILLLVSFGILAPQKLALRKSEQWAFRLAGLVRFLTALFTPLGFLAEKLSNLVVRICGMDPNADLDDVTEEEIISMVNEGHEHGVLEASEAEMIHNIIEFADKEAGDIMTHRKHVKAVDGDKTLEEALPYMLEKNNSRFPVFKGNIDYITGVVHIKDAMILSRQESFLKLPLSKVPGLVREVTFIPETRNINMLFRTMQSQKNHMAVVVDEYGQTAGIVTMEDILEEIVGNILDEYDEDDALILAQSDGSYLMRGMAPLDEVCEVLSLEYEELEDYETLNGYLISRIDKIPNDHEQFEVTDRGYRFSVLSVENKIIQTVRVTALPKPAEESEEESDGKEP